MIASYFNAMGNTVLDDLVFRVVTGRKGRVIRIALVIKGLNHSGARRIKSKSILSFDELIGEVCRMLSRVVSLRQRDRRYYSLSPFRIG